VLSSRGFSFPPSPLPAGSRHGVIAKFSGVQFESPEDILP